MKKTLLIAFSASILCAMMLGCDGGASKNDVPTKEDFAKTDPPPGYVQSHSQGNGQQATAPPSNTEGK